MKLRAICSIVLFFLLFQFGMRAYAEDDSTVHKLVPEERLKGVARTNSDNPPPTDKQLKLRNDNTQKIRELGLPTFDKLPVTEDTTKIKPRESSTVAQRVIAVAITAVAGELQGSNPQLIQDIVQQFKAKPYFTEDENAFLANPTPKKQEFINFAWRYECLHVLLWALNKHDDLKPPHQICNVPMEVGILRDAPLEEFVNKSELRSIDEIMEMADLYYRYHWAAIELRLQGKSSDIIHEGIVRERHYALNWLIRYMNQEWDAITTDT